MNDITFTPIGIINSPYKEKFAIPRQPGLVNAAKGSVKLLGDINNSNVVKELNQFSHIWLLFVFHGTQKQGWKPLVRPPRLGGNKKMGVLATRSTFRPNPIGMSVVKLDGIEVIDDDVTLRISGLDLLDQTPVIDIKPYIPYCDALPYANAGFAQTEPLVSLTVTFSKQAEAAIHALQNEHPDLNLLIRQVLIQDPRPAYKQKAKDEKVYGMNLYNLNIQWQMLDTKNIEVIKVTTL